MDDGQDEDRELDALHKKALSLGAAHFKAASRLRADVAATAYLFEELVAVVARARAVAAAAASNRDKKKV